MVEASDSDPTFFNMLMPACVLVDFMAVTRAKKRMRQCQPYSTQRVQCEAVFGQLGMCGGKNAEPLAKFRLRPHAAGMLCVNQKSFPLFPPLRLRRINRQLHPGACAGMCCCPLVPATLCSSKTLLHRPCAQPPYGMRWRRLADTNLYPPFCYRISLINATVSLHPASD